jgi:hypothetical protein
MHSALVCSCLGGDRCPELHYTSVHTPSHGRACHATVPQHGVNLNTSITSGEYVKTFLNRDVRTLCTSLHVRTLCTSLHIPGPHSRIVCGCVCPATDLRWCRHLDTCAHCRAAGFDIRSLYKHLHMGRSQQLKRSSMRSLNIIQGVAYGSLRRVLHLKRL